MAGLKPVWKKALNIPAATCVPNTPRPSQGWRQETLADLKNLRDVKYMKTNPLILTLCGAGLGLAMAAGSAQGQQQPYHATPPTQYPAPQYQAQPYSAPQGYAQQPGQYPPRYSQPAVPQGEYVSPIEFLPTFGRKFGDMFRRLFYGDTPPQGYAQPQAYPGGYPQQGQRSLDQAPGGYYPPQGQRAYPQGYAQPQTPQYERPPAAGTPANTRTQPPQSSASKTKASQAPASKASSGNTSKTTTAKKYTPPTISSKPSTSKTPAATENAPPPATSTTERRTETVADASRAEFYPLPGSQPKESTASTASGSSAAAKTKTDSGIVSGGTFLKGKRTGKEGRVTSPYPPYQELDVSGLGSGSLALDPTTNKVFEVP